MLPVETPFKVYTGIDGRPLNNGYVYFGAANQNPITNPVTVYWDAEGLIPAAQPLRTLNGYVMRGGTPANVFFDGDYSELVQDRHKQQVFYARSSREFSIATVVQEFIASLVTNTGASVIGWIQEGIGAIRRSLLDKGRETISVLDFGADPSGEESSAEAVRKAVQWARSKAGNSSAINAGAKSAVILFPPGSYLIDETVLLPMNITLRGDGATILCRNGGSTFESGYYANGVLTPNKDLSFANIVANVLSGLRFENLTFFGGDTPLYLTGCVWQSGIFNCSFYNCHIPVTARLCFYSTYDGITVRGENASFGDGAPSMRFFSNTNRVLINNVSISSRTRAMTIGEPGDEHISAQIVVSNSSIESCQYGIELTGTIRNIHIHDIYFESVDQAIFDSDGALKYNVNIHDLYSNSTSFIVDLSGLRDSYIGQVRDHSALSSVKAVTRLRQGTHGNTATVELSNLSDDNTGTNRYQLSDGVATSGTLSKYTSGLSAVMLNQDFRHNLQVSQFANQPAIFDSGWYGETPGFIVGVISGALTPVSGTEPYVITKFWYSEHTSLSYSIRVVPNPGSGAGGSDPEPIFLRGIVTGGEALKLGSAPHNPYVVMNGPTGTFRIGFTDFGVDGSDPDFAWMRNGQFTSEGIVKLIA